MADTEKLDFPTDANQFGPQIEPAYTDMSVPKADTRWYYRVSAINAKGTGTMTSNVASGFTYPAVAPRKRQPP